MPIQSSSIVAAAALRVACALLALGPMPFARSLAPQQSPAAMPSSGVAWGSGSSFALGPGCGAGVGLQSITHSFCFPDDCTSLGTLPFYQRPLAVPKFDPSLGTLLSVTLRFEADLESYLCLENLSNSCCLAGYGLEAVFGLDLGVNVPPLSEPSPIGAQVSMNSMVLLGPSDGFPDCNLGPQGPAPDGTCTGSDHLTSDFTQTSVVLVPPISDPAQLAGWILGQGNPEVRFRASAIASVSHSLCGNYSVTAVQHARMRLVVSYEYCPGPVGESFCAGDGTGTLCPCGNQGQGGEGCANSSGTGARIAGAGSASASADDLDLLAQGLVSPGSALLFAGTQDVNGGAGLPFGDGLRCARGTLVRLGARTPSAQGEASWGPGLVGALGAQPGSLTHFQVWYRDPIQSPCGAGSNSSNGLRVTIRP